MEVQTWRNLLGEIIADSHKKAKLAADLGVRAITLNRWAANESQPRQHNLRTLLKFLPSDYQSRMAELIQQEFPALLTPSEDSDQADQTDQVPSDFYASVLEATAKTRKEQTFFTISNRVLAQMLGQLDPNNVGMAVSIAVCVPPRPGSNVRSLREVLGRGTSPWQPLLSQEALFLGIESLAGYSLTQGRTLTAENRQKYLGFQAVRWETWEESAVASPIMRQNRYVGSLVVSCTQPGYFLPFRQALVEHYSHLLAMAFEPEEFYDMQNIQLLFMPAREIQYDKMSKFRHRLSEMILDASREGRFLSVEQAERLLWQQLEDELLHTEVLSSSSQSKLLLMERDGVQNDK